MVLQNYQTFIEITANMIYLVALGLGLKCLHKVHLNTECTEVRFASWLSGGFTTRAVINPPERKLAKRTSVHCVPLVRLLTTEKKCGRLWPKEIKT